MSRMDETNDVDLHVFICVVYRIASLFPSERSAYDAAERAVFFGTAALPPYRFGLWGWEHMPLLAYCLGRLLTKISKGLSWIHPLVATQTLLRLDGLAGNPPPVGTSFTTSGPGTDVGSILTTMKYDGNGSLTQLTDDRGGDTSYAYDSHDWKTAATYPDGSTETFA